MLSDEGKDIHVDLCVDGNFNRTVSASYSPKTSVSRIRSDVERFFRENIVPTGTANDDMRYSVSVVDREKLKANFRDAKGVEEAGQVLRSAGVIGKPLRNDKLGMTVTISGNALAKMTSEKATGKSVSARLHALAVANADTIFEAAFVEATHPDTHGRAEVIATHRIGSAIYDEENDRYEPALITALEYMKHGKKMYSIEAIDIGKYKNSAGQLVVVTKGGIQTPIAEFADIIAQTVAKVNGGDPRFSVSSVYTGSAADYDRPSLIHVGTGEGSQVYGWGLYGSTVRGIAEANGGRRQRKMDGCRHTVLENTPEIADRIRELTDPQRQ